MRSNLDLASRSKMLPLSMHAVLSMTRLQHLYLDNKLGDERLEWIEWFGALGRCSTQLQDLKLRGRARGGREDDGEKEWRDEDYGEAEWTARNQNLKRIRWTADYPPLSGAYLYSACTPIFR